MPRVLAMDCGGCDGGRGGRRRGRRDHGVVAGRGGRRRGRGRAAVPRRHPRADAGRVVRRAAPARTTGSPGSCCSARCRSRSCWRRAASRRWRCTTTASRRSACGPRPSPRRGRCCSSGRSRSRSCSRTARCRRRAGGRWRGPRSRSAPLIVVLLILFETHESAYGPVQEPAAGDARRVGACRSSGRAGSGCWRRCSRARRRSGRATGPATSCCAARSCGSPTGRC